MVTQIINKKKEGVEEGEERWRQYLDLIINGFKSKKIRNEKENYNVRYYCRNL